MAARRKTRLRDWLILNAVALVFLALIAAEIWFMREPPLERHLLPDTVCHADTLFGQSVILCEDVRDWAKKNEPGSVPNQGEIVPIPPPERSF